MNSSTKEVLDLIENVDENYDGEMEDDFFAEILADEVFFSLSSSWFCSHCLNRLDKQTVITFTKIIFANHS